MKPQTKLVAVTVATFWAPTVPAVCLLDDYSVSAEFARSPLVAIGKVISKASESDAKGPDGVGGTSYVIELDQIFRGSADSTISLFSENSSGRFAMHVGSKYMLFIGTDSGISSVDNCGNSTDVKHGHNVIEAVHALSTNAGPNQPLARP